MQTNDIVIYESGDGAVRLSVQLDEETVWLTQQQMSALFGRDASTISRHIANVFDEGELEEKAICKKCKLAVQTSQLLSIVWM